ncbi:PB1-F2 protein [Influenza A virus]
MEQEQDIPWTQLTEHINIQKKGNGQQTQKPGHKRTASLKQWLSLKNPIQESLKTRVLKRWKLFNKQEWTS